MTDKRIFASIIAGLLLALPVAVAQPVRDRILDYVHVTPEGACTVVRVGFTFPVRYVKHFPFSSGKELRIQIEPVAIGPAERSALFGREAITPPALDDRSPAEVTFEGDIAGGPFLTLLFTRVVSFSVRQGADYRSIVVTVAMDEMAASPSDGCTSKPPDQ